MKRFSLLLLMLFCLCAVYAQRHLTEDEWDEMNITKPIVLEFYADWCAPCRQQGQIIAQLVREFPKIEFYKVNIDREKDWFSYETKDGAIPMIQFIYKKDDRNNFYSKSTVAGFMPYHELRDSCRSILLRFNEIQRKKNIPQKISKDVIDTIISIDGVKYRMALSGAVNMGSDVLWAAYNVGAKSPNEYGEYYSWGETNPKNVYSWNTYKHAYPGNSENPRFKKYGPAIDRYNRLVIADDAAKQKWGGKWRMPVKEEMIDLINNTQWYAFTFRGVKGCVAYCEQTKNAIFFPYAGMKTEEGLVDVNNTSNIWTMDMLYTENSYFDYYEYPKFAYCMDIAGQISVEEWMRYIGFSIRPVYDEKND